MATGSGKTFILHINPWRYLHYSEGKVRHDNILLVTPYEGLSRQHLRELRESGIPSNHYGEAGSSLFLDGDLPVTVIEVTKLTRDKRGGGLSVDVAAFGIRMARGGFSDPQIRLHAELQVLAGLLEATDDAKKTHLTSVIVSTSPYHEIHNTFGTGQHTKEQFEKEHVVFQEDTDYIQKLFQLVMYSQSPT